MKTVTTTGQDPETTVYMRDANGKVLAIYNNIDTEDKWTFKLNEWFVYGSQSHGRFSTVKPYDLTFNFPLNTDSIFIRSLRFKEYELKDHLGNVRVVIDDVKRRNSFSLFDFSANPIAVNNFYPFGMMQEGRSVNTSGYRYGFNGMEMDNEVNGTGNSYDFVARMYDPRVGRFYSIDPLMSKYPSMSPYVGFADNPVLFVDPDGREFYVNNLGQFTDEQIKNPDDKTVYMLNEKGKYESITTITKNGSYVYDVSKIMMNIFKVNAEKAQKIQGDYIDYKDYVQTDAVWDYKGRNDMIFILGYDKENKVNNDTRFEFSIAINGVKTSRKNLTSSDFGNIHGGFVGNQAGFADIDLFLGAGIAEMYKDSNPFEFDLTIDQVDSFIYSYPPYGDEKRDFEMNNYGIGLSRQWSKEHGIDTKENFPVIKSIMDNFKL